MLKSHIDWDGVHVAHINKSSPLSHNLGCEMELGPNLTDVTNSHSSSTLHMKIKIITNAKQSLLFTKHPLHFKLKLIRKIKRKN